MRLFDLVAVVVGGLACLTACSDSNAAVRGSDSRMVLELGGTHGSLRGALQSAGVEPGAPRRVSVLPSPAGGEESPEPPGVPVGGDEPKSPSPSPSKAADVGAEVGAAPSLPAGPTPSRVEPPSEPDYVVVTLGERQTLIHLARKHLGDANRFREILTLNGWSEADSRRLAPGQKVKIPRSGNRSPRR